MRLPKVIEHHLFDWSVTSKQPFCMLLGSENQLLDCWGPAALYGLETLTRGQSATDTLPFLTGYAPDESVELPFITDAAGRTFHLHLFPGTDGRYVLYLDAREDLEHKRLTQQAANETRLLLERERRVIDELIDARSELTLRRKEAEAESKRRGEYIATMSHEFRTPLAALLAHVEDLGDRPAPEQAAETANFVRRIAQQQLWMIDNLLTRARFEADGFAIHPSVTNLRTLVDDLCLLFAPLAAERELSFAAYVADDLPEFLIFDDLHLRQVLVNLVSNAIKYTPSGGVTMEFSYRDEQLTARVTDTGPGIAAEEQALLFKAFQRGRQAPRTLSAGLGLSITRALVESMQGRLDLNSARGRGTTVTVQLPAPAAETLTHAAATGSILIGEDDPDIGDLLTLRLGEAGYAVKLVADGRAVVEQALEHAPDLVIVDTNMPGLDGPSAARTLREHGFNAPILALSAASSRHDIDYALSSGCTEFLRKPAYPETLKRLVAQLLLAHRRAQRVQTAK